MGTVTRLRTWCGQRVGQRVRLLVDVTTRWGTTLRAGTEYVIAGSRRGRFSLIDPATGTFVCHGIAARDLARV